MNFPKILSPFIMSHVVDHVDLRWISNQLELAVNTSCQGISMLITEMWYSLLRHGMNPNPYWACLGDWVQSLRSWPRIRALTHQPGNRLGAGYVMPYKCEDNFLIVFSYWKYLSRNIIDQSQPDLVVVVHAVDKSRPSYFLSLGVKIILRRVE